MSDPNANAPMPNGTITDSTSTPIPSNVVYSILRAFLLLLGALGVTLPAALNDQSAVANIAGVIAILIGMVWQPIAEWRHAKATHNAAIASATLGRAVQVR